MGVFLTPSATLWAKWAIAQGPALKGAPHLLKGLLKIKEREGKKNKKDRRVGGKVKKEIK